MNVLSLFDGMSCGQIALNRAGIKYDKYFASEIDKYAIQVTQKNYPNTIQLGDIRNIHANDLPKIDLLIGGSPCQGFSVAGKGLNFNDPRSALFFEYIRLLKECKPKYFLLENVRMKAEYNDVISSTLGEIYPKLVKFREMFRAGRLEPILINSALVSAQNRQRLYWTNIKVNGQPEDRGILLKDIIENGETERDKSNVLTSVSKDSIIVIRNEGERDIILNTDIELPFMLKEVRSEEGKQLRKQAIKIGKDTTPRTKTSKEYVPNEDGKANCITTNNGDMLSKVCIQVGEADIKGRDSIKRVYSIEGKSPTLTSMTGGNRQPKIATKDSSYKNRLVKIYEDTTLIIRRGRQGLGIGCKQIGKADISGNYEKPKRVYGIEGKSPSIRAGEYKGPSKISIDNITWRKLTVRECERLQTVPDDYTKGVSNSQRYKMLGNGWTVDVIVHILKGMEL